MTYGATKSSKMELIFGNLRVDRIYSGYQGEFTVFIDSPDSPGALAETVEALVSLMEILELNFKALQEAE